MPPAPLPTVTFLLPDGARHVCEAPAGATLLEVARRHDIAIEGACGGAMACATCHVRVDEAWLAKTGRAGNDEADLLDMSDYRADNSRLSCQIKCAPALDGLTLALQLDAFEG